MFYVRGFESRGARILKLHLELAGEDSEQTEETIVGLLKAWANEQPVTFEVTALELELDPVLTGDRPAEL